MQNAFQPPLLKGGANTGTVSQASEPPELVLPAAHSLPAIQVLSPGMKLPRSSTSSRVPNVFGALVEPQTATPQFHVNPIHPTSRPKSLNALPSKLLIPVTVLIVSSLP